MRFGRAARAVAAVWLILAGPAQAGEPTAVRDARLVLGTATPGGGFPAWGAALVEAVRGADAGLAIEVRATGGSAENLRLLREGAVDIALVQGAFAYPALAERDDPAATLSVVAPMYPTPGLFVTPAASAVRAIADLRGRPVALGTRASGLTAMGRVVLAASGLDPDRDVQPILLDRAGDGPALLASGAVAALWGGGLGWPGFLAAAAAPGGARFLGPSPEAIPRAIAASPALRPMRVPAGSFAGQDAAIDTVGSWSLVLARPGLDAERVARLARAMARGLSTLARLHPQGAEADPRGLPGIVPAAWIAVGTARMLRENGR